VTTFRACSSPAPTLVKPQPAPAILSQESFHTTLSITHHTRKRPSTGPQTTHGPQTSSSEHRKTDRPRGARGLSARHPRTVRPAHADRPKPRPMKTQSHDGSKAKRSKNTKNTRRTVGRGPSAIGTRTFRPLRTVLKTARPRRSTPPIHHRISQMVEAVETRVWGHDKR
jgi:hypothetical protein